MLALSIPSKKIDASFLFGTLVQSHDYVLLPMGGKGVRVKEISQRISVLS